MYSVKSRLASESGISFTEFSYQLLQAQDYLHLHLNHNCAVQLGGSDQWGNIVAGIDLIHRHYSDVAVDRGVVGVSKKDKDQKAARQERAFGLTIPLLTTASGAKFGKSAGNAVWLDERLTSLFDFYQVRFPLSKKVPFVGGSQSLIRLHLCPPSSFTEQQTQTSASISSSSLCSLLSASRRFWPSTQ